MKKTIIVDTVQSTPKTIVIQTKNGEMYRNGEPKFDKYKIWINDQNGQPSRAYTQYQKLRPIAGDSFEVEVFEKESSFTNPQGKLINYTDRTINYFYLDNEGNPTTPISQNLAPTTNQNTQPVQTPIPSPNTVLEERIRVSFEKRDKQIAELLEMVLDLKQKLEYMTTLFKDHSKEAFEVHKDQLPDFDPSIPALTEEDLKNFGK